MIVPDIEFKELKDLAFSVGKKIGQELAKRAKLVREKVTASIGAKMVVAGEEAEKVMGEVDQMLYKAKEGGRNRLVIEKNKGRVEMADFG